MSSVIRKISQISSVPTFLTSNEAESAENLIKAYQKGENEQFKKETTKASVTTLYPLIVRIFFTIQIIKKLRGVVVPSAEAFHSADQAEK